MTRTDEVKSDILYNYLEEKIQKQIFLINQGDLISNFNINNGNDLKAISACNIKTDKNNIYIHLTVLQYYLVIIFYTILVIFFNFDTNVLTFDTICNHTL